MVRIWIVGVVSAALVYYPAGLRAQHRTSEYYNAWLNEDVAYIVTDEERAVFGRLNSDEERDQFIEQFWFRRDPTPDTLENEFKEEHYRRMAYANEHFACALPGWHADRGRIYIAVGPPDEIQSHPSVPRAIENGLQKPPAVKFKDLEASAGIHISYNILPMRVETDFIRVTNASVLANVAMQFEGGNKAAIHVYGRIATPSRWVIEVFERTVESSVLQVSFPLAPGTYRMNIVGKDVAAGSMQSYETVISVPRFQAGLRGVEYIAASKVVL